MLARLPPFKVRRRPLLFRKIHMPSLTGPRPVDWKAAAPPIPNFAAQHDSLPRLPVPNLTATLERLKTSLLPLAHSEAEFTAAVKKIDAFGSHAGSGSILQSRLMQRASEREHWLEEWWDDLGYLGYRDSVVVNVSYYYGFDGQPAHLPQSPAARAAGLARGALVFRQKLLSGQVSPDGTKEGQFCMDTYRWMFDCCRIPGLHGLDWSASHAGFGVDELGHIIIVRRNRFWKLKGIINGRILSMTELEKQIQYIYDSTTEEYPGVGVLTASNRDVWAKDHAHLAADPHNASILHTIHSSAFLISLDTDMPSSSIANSRSLWHGSLSPSTLDATGLKNRWVDKPVEFIVFDNARAGLMGEHSVMDGTPTVRMCDEVLDWLADPAFDLGAPSAIPPPKPEPLDFVVDDTTRTAIDKASKAAYELADSQSMSYHLTSYGKAAIKAFRVSPDSWAQMIIQLAYARLLPEGGTYEAATTRRYWKGRTETIRVVTSQSDAFVSAMDDPRVSCEDRKQLFDAAGKAHIALAKAAGSGEGVDRHMLGMKMCLREGEPVPELYNDPLYKRSGNWVLSTSAVFSDHFPQYGWGEVVPEGFGVAYMTGYDDRLQFTVTSRKEMPNQEFMNEIARAAVDLYDLHAGQRKSML
ncbi:acyltransferase ChoActase/COT/CPT [Suillus fuscotomentosus]|uniref:Acyltransferase ChoActase/COT/CPT n=1 Tax=Suillus fuscotomentosus TaxID=1912939 RepID=A0AAD4EKD1_9AGAM|nr:acyltransferase ChoActase/COT/CPT [Suillus fuscotomentosus]KAG1907808.1 acyltransferase ChoActase/COT/CPT [Suillus fuscotomentosus]